MKWLIGHTGYSLFDVWSIAHLAFWLFAGSVLWSMKFHRPSAFFACMMVAYVWEGAERYLEKAHPTIWLNPESWFNSMISDPLMCAIGVLGMWYALDHWRTP